MKIVRMNRASLALTVLLAALRTEADLPKLDSHLEPLRPLLEKTWRGPFKNSKPDQPVIDIAHWERALNGRAVRILHSINNGVYGGETLIMWDEQKQSVVYHYFTTAGFDTEGTMTFKEGKITSTEKVQNDKDGTTEVRAVMDFLPMGGFHVKADYLTKGEWKLGHEADYKEDATAKVVFK